MEGMVKPCVAWSYDCQGKQDYDGRLISISTRYWPSNYRSDGRPSAKASIVLNYGAPDAHAYGDAMPWREAEFTALTEGEVKAQVEAWVQARFDEVRVLLGMT